MWKFFVYVAGVLSILLADQSEISALTGGTGWVGASILGGVLAWLLFMHLPAKDKFMKEIITDKDKQINAILESKWLAMRQMSDNHTKVVESLSAQYQTTLDKVVEHCDTEVQRVIQIFNREREEDEERRKK